MVITNRVTAIFTDARTVYADALERLEQGDIRDAAEKAWCATKRAADALILARTGEEPEKSPVTSKELRELAAKDRRVDGLVSRYYSRMGALHGECFYLGLCEPIEDTERRIRETALYIRDAESLAQS
jgi:uncharacterized protein (UPF0332 family)